MSQVLVTESYLEDIADAIRGKNGLLAQYKPGQMAAAIEAIPTGGSAILTTKTITSNGTYDAEDDNADGYSSVTVNVPGQSAAYVVNATLAHNGYISNGKFFYSPSDAISLYCFLALNNHGYAFLKNGGNRFRVARFSTDIAQATADVTGTTITNADSNNPYAAGYYNNTGSDFYIGFMVSNQDGNTPAMIIDLNAIS